MSKVCIFHTGISTFAPLQALAQELMPGVEFMHIVEDALIKDVMKAGGPDADISARIALYVMSRRPRQVRHLHDRLLLDRRGRRGMPPDHPG